LNGKWITENLLSAHWHTSSEHRRETMLLLFGAEYSTEHLLSGKNDGDWYLHQWQIRAYTI